jgi:hypothetical protein
MRPKAPKTPEARERAIRRDLTSLLADDVRDMLNVDDFDHMVTFGIVAPVKVNLSKGVIRVRVRPNEDDGIERPGRVEPPPADETWIITVAKEVK